jgi:ribonuclease PH
MTRQDRSPGEIRPIDLQIHVNDYAEGSCLITLGKTKVMCTASLEKPAPKWVQATGGGWVTAEYGMLPRSTHERMKRDKAMNSGRSLEISRLIGRALRSAVDLSKMPDCQITIDCDVLHADGSTRCASITGGYVALALALRKLHDVGELPQWPLVRQVVAISAGLQNEQVLVDLDYEEDSSIHTDMNFVFDHVLNLIEVQGTAEKSSFSKNQFLSLWEAAEKGAKQLLLKQAEILNPLLPEPFVKGFSS